jgi:hypothetical protein
MNSKPPDKKYDAVDSYNLAIYPDVRVTLTAQCSNRGEHRIVISSKCFVAQLRHYSPCT